MTPFVIALQGIALILIVWAIAIVRADALSDLTWVAAAALLGLAALAEGITVYILRS